jgi:hypothetical protein
VSKLDLLSPLGLLLSEKQVPQVVVKIENQTQTMEPFEAMPLSYKQDAGGSSPSPPTITLAFSII